ncbi:hypothetical protein WA026_016349 [Henosepilachna vigintioctopunctata]|uniref:Ionotropic receptor n=1 Tax=Henosepilachna vigintioctopunctata TaxID=420089 RepID=A0AAW1UNC1_9CUCU
MHLVLPGKLSLTLMQCINIIIKNVTKPAELINVLNMEGNYEFPATRLDLTQNLHSNFDYTQKSKFYIMGNFTQIELNATLSQFKGYQASLFNPWAKFLFLGSNFSRDFVGAVSRESIYNALFLNTASGTIYTFFPYLGKRLISTPTLRIIGDCDALKVNELFPTKHPDNWAGYKLLILFRRIDIYAICSDCKEPGIEIEVVKLISDHLKIETSFFDNESLINTFGNQNKYGVLIGNRVTVSLFFAEHTVSFIHDYLRWFVPSSRKVFGWFDNFFGLGIDFFIVWIFSIFIFITVSLSVVLISYIYPSEFGRRSYFNGIHFAIGSITVEREHKYNVIKLIVIMCLGFLMFATYIILFAKLVMFSAHPVVYSAKFQTTEDISKNHLKVGSFSALGDKYIDESSGLKGYPKFLRFLIQNFEKLMLETTIAEKERMTILSVSRIGRYITLTYINRSTGLPYYKELKQSYYDDHTVLVFTKGNPVFLVFNRKLKWLIESGIVSKIIRKYEKYLNRNNENLVGRLKLKGI